MEAQIRYRDRLKNGVPSPRLGRGLEAARGWLCRYLQSVGCECGERRIPCLQLYWRTPPSERRHTVAELVSRGASHERLAQAAEDCVVMCANCRAIHVAREKQSYRLAAPDRLAGDVQPPSGGVLAAKPKLAERGHVGVGQAQVVSASPANLPADKLNVQAAPDQPADSRPHVDVGDLPASVAPGDPRLEDQPGGRVNHPVDAGQDGPIAQEPVNEVVLGGRVLGRRARQR